MFALLLLVLPFIGVSGTAIFVLIVTILVYFYFVIRKRQSVWERKGVKYVKPTFLLGSLEIIPSKHLSEKMRDKCNSFPEDRYFGMYQLTMATLVIKDPDLIKQITVKDFDHFVNHRPVVDTNVDPFWSKNLFASRDDRWRDLRATLSPSFTGSKMKIMYNLMEECAKEFVHYFEKQDKQVIELEMKDALTRYTNDVIATTAFGLKCNSLEDQKNKFFEMGKEASNFNIWKIFSFFIYAVSPTLCRLLRVKITSSHVTKYFSEIIEATLRTRKENNIVRPDMIHLLLEAQKENKKEITLEDIYSQAFIFFLAGFETSSIFLTFTFYELAINPEVQDRLRKEIQTVSTITYESLQNLKYLDMVMSEVLRKWPPFGITDREVSKDFTIEPVKPDEKPLLLEKGLVCAIPITAIHYDKKYFPNPEKFDPERFNEENRPKIHPCSYMPFGSGPRNCIGSRFALLEGKLIIAHVLKKFEVVQIERTSNPAVLDKNQINVTVKGGMWLGLKKIEPSE